MRTYKRKSSRGTISEALIQRAADAVIKENRKIKTVAKELDICHMTLHRYVRKLKSGENPKIGYKKVRLVFTEEQEKELVKYLLKCSAIFFGLLPHEVRKLAYECAVKFNVPGILPSWHKNRSAGPDWLAGFLKRNRELSIRTPESTSMSRAASFNKHNVHEFFKKLNKVLKTHKFAPSRIYNLDEIGVTTVLKPRKIIAKKGMKQVGGIVSAERGTLVTVELAVNALGNSIPPMFVFPRIKYKDIFIKGGPPESIGAGNSSGWMTATEFIIYMDHFIKHTCPTPSNPVLLILDNHHSHVDINVVEKAKANSIVMLSFPPHCTHRLQPLDVGINAPFKNYCAKAQDNWLRNNPGKTMTIYEIPDIVKYALPLAATPVNIINSFKKTGIWPFNANIFSDDDFAPCFVTDQPRPSKMPEHDSDDEIWDDPGPSCSRNPQKPLGVREESVAFAPEIVRPYPKAPPRITKNKRRIRKSAILTDTPERQALAEDQSKKRKRNFETSSTVKSKNKENLKSKGKRKCINPQVSSSEEEDNLDCQCIICSDTYYDSRPGEEWVQCQMCNKWAHSRCQNKLHSLTYICEYCDSDASCND